MKNRRNLTPPPPAGDGAADGIHATRRGGARHEISARVSLNAGSGPLLEGWALNVSKGGVRVILEDKVELGAEFEVTVLGIGGAAPIVPAASAPPAGPGAPGTPPGLAGGAAATIAAPSAPEPVPQRGRVVWVQEEPDGVVIGIEFVAHAKP